MEWNELVNSFPDRHTPVVKQFLTLMFSVCYEVSLRQMEHVLEGMGYIPIQTSSEMGEGIEYVQKTWTVPR